jgi:peptidoglycan/LPS O-acetylase OafA/YrhL
LIANRSNNFALLRLLFSSFVIVSHSPELIDGNRSREILTRVFGTMSFGEIAVDGFFLISGFLITQSFVRSESTAAYFRKRMLRIIPGYLTSFLLCALCIAPFAGNGRVLSIGGIRSLLLQMVTLSPPWIPGVFVGLPYPALNNAMWTIAYEFRCYLLVAALGMLGAFRPKYRPLLALAVGMLLVVNATGALRDVHTGYLVSYLVGDPVSTIRLSAVFGVGVVYYLFRNQIPLTQTGAAFAAVVLAGAMFWWRLAETSYAIFGGYLILYFALKLPMLHLSSVANKSDISYGLYLYGWPIQTLIIWNDHTIDPWLLCSLSLAAAATIGYASWRLVEKPCLNLAHTRRASLVFESERSSPADGAS